MRELFKIVLIICSFTTLAAADGRTQVLTLNPATSKSLAARESGYMAARYTLTPAQLTAVTSLNERYYLRVATILTGEKNKVLKRERIADERLVREKKLQVILSATQYSQFKRDMDSAALRAQRQVTQFNVQSRKGKSTANTN